MLVTSEPYGLVRVSTLKIVRDAIRNGERRDATWFNLFPEIVGIIKDGGSLRGVEATWLHDYLVACGLFEVELDEVQTVQIPRDWAASRLSAGDRGAERAIRGLQEAGVLDKVHDGVKGHAALFAVMPLTVPEPNPPPPQ